VFVLPNLSLRDRDVERTPLTLGLNGIAIVPSTDERIEVIRGWSHAADRFLASFHDGTGNEVQPSVLISKDSWTRKFKRSAEPVIAFRNAIALSCILPSRAGGRRGSWIGVSWSDVFDFHPAQLRIDGSDLDVMTPSRSGYGTDYERLSLSVDLGVARPDLGAVDRHLAARLGRVWRDWYLRGRGGTRAARVFRSLELAYQASRMNFENYGSLHDAGLTAIRWVAAIEVLAFPDGDRISRSDGMDLVGRFRWDRTPELRHRRYRVVEKRRKGRVVRMKNVNLAERAYDHLYAARSRFVHGDRVSEGLLVPFGRSAPSILSLASTLYRMALIAYLEQHWPWKATVSDLTSLDFLRHGCYEDHLMAVVEPERWQ